MTSNSKPESTRKWDELYRAGARLSDGNSTPSEAVADVLPYFEVPQTEAEEAVLALLNGLDCALPRKAAAVNEELA
jgi:hypothetical protein